MCFGATFLELFGSAHIISDTAYTWYDSQGYEETMVIFATMKSNILDYFIPSDYIRRARRALIAFKMG